MAEKRFVVEKYSVRDMSIDEKYVNSSYHIGDKGIAQSLCDLLNKLHEENKNLKHELRYLENKDRDNRLERIRMINQMRYR